MQQLQRQTKPRPPVIRAPESTYSIHQSRSPSSSYSQQKLGQNLGETGFLVTSSARSIFGILSGSLWIHGSSPHPCTRISTHSLDPTPVPK